jgi:hypothetical protein
MRTLLATAILGLALAQLARPAQAQTTWTGTGLSITGTRSNGCDMRVIEVTHSGSTLSSLRFVVANRAMSAARVTIEVTMTGNNQRKSGTISGLLGGGQMGTLTGFHPFGGSLAGSTVSLRFLGCTAG